LVTAGLGHPEGAGSAEGCSAGQPGAAVPT
jgi:hypothetical protein